MSLPKPAADLPTRPYELAFAAGSGVAGVLALAVAVATSAQQPGTTLVAGVVTAPRSSGS